MPTRAIRSIASLVWRLGEGRAGWTVLLSLLAGASEGLSLMMLIPLAAAASPEGAAGLARVPVIGPWLGALAPGLPVLLAVFVVLVAGQAVLGYWRSVASQRLVQRIAERLRHDLFAAFAHARWDAIAARPLADVSQALGFGIGRCVSAASALLGLVQGTILGVIYLGLAALVSWPMALFAVGIGALLFAALHPLRRAGTRYGHELTGVLRGQEQISRQFLNGIRLAKVLTAEDRFIERYDRHIGAARANAERFAAVTARAGLLFQIGIAAAAALFVYIAIARFALGLGELAALLLVFARLAPRFRAMQDQGQQLLANAPAADDYLALLGQYSAAREAEPATAAEAAPSLRHEIELRAVSVAYPEAPAPALDRVSVRIAAGQITALAGPSGAGKSTLADLVMGLTVPSDGEILIDGTGLAPATRRSWRGRVACVPQDVLLFDASLRDNLLLAVPGASDAALWHALERAQIASLVRTLPDGLETPVGERGTRFSGGERQRIAIARALVAEPELIIFDEPVSALDLANQREIANSIAALRDGRLTVLVIAHQPDLLAIADAVITLAAGRVVAEP